MIELRKLSQKHKTIVSLHLQCVRREDIARIVGCTPEYVSFVVRQPLAQEYARTIEQYMDARLRSLYSKSVDAIQSALESESHDAALKAARLQLEAIGKLKSDKDSRESAEDVVSKILSAVQVNVNVNVRGNNAAETPLAREAIEDI